MEAPWGGGGALPVPWDLLFILKFPVFTMSLFPSAEVWRECVCVQCSPRISPLYAEQELGPVSPQIPFRWQEKQDWRRAVPGAQSWWVSCWPAGGRALQMGRIPHTAPAPKLSEGREPPGPLQGLQWVFLKLPFQSVQIISDGSPGSPRGPLSDLLPAQTLACSLGQGAPASRANQRPRFPPGGLSTLERTTKIPPGGSLEPQGVVSSRSALHPPKCFCF